MPKTISTVFVLSCLWFLLCPEMAQATVIDFEGFSDGDVVTNELSGLSFANTVIFSLGISLNEFELPPASGANVASDNGGPLSIIFSSPVTSVGAYLTYLVPVSFIAFDAGDSQIGQVDSLFASNLALTGDLGSSPNEFLQIIFPAGIKRVTFTGNAAGGSFALDDLTFEESSSIVPEPSTRALLLSIIPMFIGITVLRNKYKRN